MGKGFVISGGGAVKKSSDTVAAEKDWSSQQLAVFDAAVRGGENVMVEAVAGSGKSSTIAEGCKRARKKAMFLAFNKSVADSMEARIGELATARTLNSLGWEMLKSKNPKIKLNAEKITDMGEEIFGRVKWRMEGGKIGKLASMAKNFYPNGGVKEAAAEAGIVLEKEIEEMADRILKEGEDTEKWGADFDDQLYLPVKWGVRGRGWERLFVDEAQDLSPVQIELVRALASESGMVAAVGDKRQSIYGFRGADGKAMDKTKAALGARSLPLTVTFRCPKRVVELAQTVAPEIEAAEWAEEGEIKTVETERGIGDGVVSKWGADLVLCRTNAPLVECCIGLARRGKSSFIEGRDMLARLRSLYDKAVATMRGYGTARNIKEAVMEVAMEEAKGLRERGLDKAAENVIDAGLCVAAVAANMPEGYDVLEVRMGLERLFAPSPGAIKLSTIHKAKGGEADRVAVLKHDSMPLKTRTETDAEQELNLIYVAYTRARKALLLINGGRNGR